MFRNINAAYVGGYLALLAVLAFGWAAVPAMVTSVQGPVLKRTGASWTRPSGRTMATATRRRVVPAIHVRHGLLRNARPVGVSTDAADYPNAAWASCRLASDCSAVLAVCGLHPVAVSTHFGARMAQVQATASRRVKCPSRRAALVDPHDPALVPRCRERRCVIDFHGKNYDWRGVAVAHR